MKNKRLLISIILMALLTGIFASYVYAASVCPKGKACTFRGCGQYEDANGNLLCDLAEGDATVIPTDSQVYSSQSSSQASSSTVENTTNESASEVVSTSEVVATSEEIEAPEEVEEAVVEDNTAAQTQLVDAEAVNTTDSSYLQKCLDFFKSNILIAVYALFLLVATGFSKISSSKKARERLRLFTLVLSAAILGFYFQGCICPIGALQNLPLKFAGVASGMYLQWLLLLLLPILFIFIAGRIFCSSVCPLGAVSEILFNIGRKLGLNKGRPGLENARWTRYIKYVVLVWLIVFTSMTGLTLFCSYDPFATLFSLGGSLISLGLLVIVLISSLFISRPWCRIICPYGALLGIINKLSSRKIKMRCKSCNGCTLCQKQCPVDAITVSTDSEHNSNAEIDYFECISCNKCK